MTADYYVELELEAFSDDETLQKMWHEINV